MDARKFLQQIEKIELQIKNKKYEKERWDDIATSITAQMGGERVQTSGSKEKMAKAVIEAVAVQEQIDVLLDTISEVYRVIEKLDTKYYKFIHKIYVQGMTLREVASSEGYSYSWATTMHSRALKEVQRILDGEKKRRC